ncbi:MAG: alanine racemase, partial [Sulfurimonadaceae bacterium]
AGEIKEYFEKILVLAGHEYVVDEKLHYAINTLSQIDKMPGGALVELKVDTGMHRNGVAMDELEKALSQISEQGLVLKGVFTHNRSADTLSSEWFWQRKNFEKVKEQVSALQTEYGYETPRFHSSNSASTFRFKKFNEDLVRVGIAAYGCLEMDQTLEQPDLQPVMTLTAQKIATRRLQQGEHVGYNATFRAEKEMVVSTYDVGYADGLLRAASNRYTSPEGEQLLGRISMDNSSFTGEKEALVIFENVNRYAEAAGTIGYEILVGLHPEIKRVVI